MLARAESMKTVGSCTAAGCPQAAFMKRQKEEQRVPWCPAVRPVARLEGTQGSREGGSSPPSSFQKLLVACELQQTQL